MARASTDIPSAEGFELPDITIHSMVSKKRTNSKARASSKRPRVEASPVKSASKDKTSENVNDAQIKAGLAVQVSAAATELQQRLTDTVLNKDSGAKDVTINSVEKGSTEISSQSLHQLLITTIPCVQQIMEKLKDAAEMSQKDKVQYQKVTEQYQQDKEQYQKDKEHFQQEIEVLKKKVEAAEEQTKLAKAEEQATKTANEELKQTIFTMKDTETRYITEIDLMKTTLENNKKKYMTMYNEYNRVVGILESREESEPGEEENQEQQQNLLNQPSGRGSEGLPDNQQNESVLPDNELSAPKSPEAQTSIAATSEAAPIQLNINVVDNFSASPFLENNTQDSPQH